MTHQPDFTSPIAGRVEVREPCPFCPDRPMIARVLMDEHVAEQHPDVQTVEAAGVAPAADPEPSDPTQCSGEEGFCPEHGFHRHSLKQPGQPEPGADQSALRNAVCEALHGVLNRRLGEGAWTSLLTEAADEMLAVLPASVDRADVLRWAADHLETLDPVEAALAGQDAWKDAAAELRRVAAETHGTTGHTYLSTGCLHGEHAYCQSNTGANGAKSPAQCKFCAAPCRCSCHLDTETAPPAPSAGGVRQPKEADDRLRCPRCAEDITDYDEDDHVFRTGDDRPYCSGECVIAAHRKGIPTETPTPCGPAPSECDAESGEPCADHEREQSHAEGEHCFCGPECDDEAGPAVGRQTQQEQ